MFGVRGFVDRYMIWQVMPAWLVRPLITTIGSVAVQGLSPNVAAVVAR